ncbi:MAG TPA: anthranilate synthase component I [Deinococcales bacterium]|nr:anthranilate synthase component I [Deinococcales bacterium]
MLADLETPVSAFLKASQNESHAFLLESVEGGERWARFSFIGVGARGTFTVRDRQAHATGTLSASGPEERFEARDPLRVLYERVSGPVEAAPDLPAFTGGVVGFTAYDLARTYERLPSSLPDDLNVPDAAFVEPEGLVIFDHLRHHLSVVATAVRGDAGSLARAERTVETLLSRLRGPLPGVPGDRPSPAAEFTANITPEAYRAAVERALEYIRAGDIFQVVLSQRFSAPLKTHPFAVYRALRAVNPSPYMGYLKLGDLTLVAASPESLCRSDGRRVVTRPIAGTRPRGRTPGEDEALGRELLADEKERAEHVMLVDLGRNDLGRVSRFGSVRVGDLMTTERYSHVMHLVSSVEGELAPGKTPLDALAATLPMGTVSGAPKVRAMEIIEELEATRRGWYGGAFGYLAHDGSMDMALTLRTALAHEGRIHVQAGAGIVADSDPETEYRECLNKALALRRAVEMAEAGL